MNAESFHYRDNTPGDQIYFHQPFFLKSYQLIRGHSVNGHNSRIVSLILRKVLCFEFQPMFTSNCHFIHLRAGIRNRNPEGCVF